jgi:tRNA threonylcarbamoyladenosine biosynthesis protein TsaE
MEAESVVSDSESETVAVAIRFAARLAPGDWVGLIGPLGAGKSVFVRGIGEALGVKAAMPSPSYTILNCHHGRMPLYHLDLYRIGSGDELDFAGVESYLGADGVCLVEWADRIRERWPQTGWIIEVDPISTSSRRIQIWKIEQK